MPTKPSISALSPAELRARARECRALVEHEPSARLTESVLRLAARYEAMALKLEAEQRHRSVVVWERRREYFVAFVETRGRVDFVLNIKRHADPLWEWCVRRPGQLSAVAKGTAGTVQEAMREAERLAVPVSP